VDWHIRHVPGVVTLLREELRGCSEHAHAPECDLERWQRSHPRIVPDGDMLDDGLTGVCAGVGRAEAEGRRRR
jgi:hypothetical protein